MRSADTPVPKGVLKKAQRGRVLRPDAAPRPHRRPLRRPAVRAALAAALLQAACSSLPPAPTGATTPAAPAAAGATPATAPRTAAPEPGRSTMAEVLALWGEPRGRTVFAQGHQVWHYYHPRDGWSLASWLPGVHLASTERGRRATERVLLFDAQGVLVQSLIRELP